MGADRKKIDRSGIASENSVVENPVVAKDPGIVPEDPILKLLGIASENPAVEDPVAAEDLGIGDDLSRLVAKRQRLI